MAKIDIPLSLLHSHIPAKMGGVCFPWSRFVILGSAESEKVRLIRRELIFAEFKPMTAIPQRYRRTDGRTTCSGSIWSIWIWISAAKVLRRPCGRFIPSIPLPAFVSPPQSQGSPSLPPSSFSLPCPFSFPFPPLPQPLPSLPFPPLNTARRSGGVLYVSSLSGVGGAPAKIEFGAFSLNI